MSKFIDHLQNELTGKRNYVSSPLMVSEKVSPAFDCTLEHIYFVKWEMKVVHKPEDSQEVTKNIIRQLKEEIYGDLREYLIQLERSIYERDNRKTIEIKNKIIDECFG